MLVKLMFAICNGVCKKHENFSESTNIVYRLTEVFNFLDWKF